MELKQGLCQNIEVEADVQLVSHVLEKSHRSVNLRILQASIGIFMGHRDRRSFSRPLCIRQQAGKLVHDEDRPTRGFHGTYSAAT